MALLGTYDLSTGVTKVEVANPANWRVTAKTTGCPDGQNVVISFKVKGEAIADFYNLKSKGKAVKLRLEGNAIDGETFSGCNAVTGEITISPQEGSTGTIEIDSYNQ